MSGEAKKAKPKQSVVRAKKVVTSLLKTDGDMAAAGRLLGISRQAVKRHVDKNPLVKSGLEKYIEKLEKAGATDEKSARVISEAMDAKRKVGLGHGDDFTVEEEVDHYARLKANEQYLKIKRLVGDSKTAPAAPEQHLHLHLQLKDKNSNELIGEIRDQLAALGIGKPDSQSRPA